MDFKHKVPLLKTAVNYTNDLDENDIWNFLIHTGYLTYEHKKGEDFGYAFIPNQEIYSEWKDVLKKIVANPSLFPLSNDLKNALITFDIDSIKRIMDEIILYPSFHDNAPENSYHMFFFGCFFSILHDEVNFNVVSSNNESGHGRYDIKIELRQFQKVIIFEFKKSEGFKDLDHDSDLALKQIKVKKYDVGNRNCERLLIGVSFYKKYMSKLKVDIINF
jgi:PD-(D/E)XK nuclease superfamily